MKVVYFSNPVFADCDFPLIKEMQKCGLNVRYYMPIGHKFSQKSIIELEKPICRWGIYRASKIKEMEKYKDCLDLDSLFFIYGINRIWWPFTWLLWICVYIHILFYKANVIHITWQLRGLEKILFYIPFISNKVMTVHDPLQHSSTKDYVKQEKLRLSSFKWANSFILLNKQQVEAFAHTYCIERNRIFISKLGIYDSIKYLNISGSNIQKQYILFFGQIFPYKGIEYLLDAMLKVNEKHKDIELIVAGSGDFYFDMSKYSNKEFIKILNRYIGITELVGLVKNCLFVVLPYKDATQSGVVQTAFALDIPIVATKVGALPDMVKNDVFGKIVPPCDTDALATAIISLIENQTELERLKRNIVTQYIPDMLWTPIVDDYVKVYKNNFRI